MEATTVLRNHLAQSFGHSHNDLFERVYPIFLLINDGSEIRKVKLQIYLQSNQTLLTDCFTLTGSSEGNLKHITAM